MDRTTYVVLREFDDSLSADDLEAADERIARAVETLRDEGQDVEWLESIRLETDENDRVAGTIDRYRADRRESLAALAERADLPETRVWREAGRRDGDRVDRRQGR